jgi:HAD superfamily hydrolase (TIGR01484 family)
MNEMEKKVNLALNNGGNKNLIKRHSYINDNKKNYDNSKFEKYNTEKMRYELIKDYSFIHPEINENFLERMEFDLMKRKNKETKLNEFVEKNKNKYKLNENKRNKTFNRLIADANRRNIMKQEIIENERLLTDYKSILDNEKKYNQEDWNKIYNKRFKEYEDIKKKKIDIQRQNEKLKKMIKEEEEINMCKIKKMPLNKIKETSNRLYNESKKREYLRSNRSFISDKNTNNFKHDKNKISFTNFNDEEDASRYMKNYKPEEYSFISNKRNIFDDNENNFFKKKNYNEIFNKSFDRRNLKKNSRITNTEFNNLRFNTNNSYIIPYKKTKKVNLTPLNNTRKFKNNIQNYFNFKNNKKEINQLENEYIHNPNSPIPTKLVIEIKEGENINEWLTICRDKFADGFDIFASGSIYIEFVAPSVSKGEAIRYLMKEYNLNEDEVAVIGDAANDISMFLTCNHSYCMHTATPSVKKYADKIVKTAAEAMYDVLAKNERERTQQL